MSMMEYEASEIGAYPRGSGEPMKAIKEGVAMTRPMF